MNQARQPPAGGNRAEPYESRRLSYATTFPEPGRAAVIRALEWGTGKRTLLRRIRAFERAGVPEGQPFWNAALARMGIALRTPPEQVDRIPMSGPLVVVANHPHGLVDGMVLAALVGRVREDYRILVRSLLAGVAEIDRFLLPVPFPHEPDARARNVGMRRRAAERLATGGAVILFPAGGVAQARRPFGPAVEAPWSAFTATLIQRSEAQVVPVRFTGQNSRLYQLAALTSPTLRQGLLLHEVVHALDKPQSPVIGYPVPRDDLARFAGDPAGLAAHLRAVTLALDQRVGTGVSPR